MLPTDRFLVLGETLLPPEGYEIDALLATTFSLDLATALGLPLALIRQGQFAGNTPEMTSRLAVIEAIKRFAGCYRVFCDAGGIHVPPRRWRALSLLDQVVVPISIPARALRGAADGGGRRPSFHPKMVLVRFGREGAPARVRVVCMSRNLTSDAALDVSVVIEGEVGRPEASQRSDRLAGAIEALLPWAVRDDHRIGSRGLVRSVASSVRKTRWQPPPGFESVAFWPFGLGDASDPVLLEGEENRLLVVSPFLSPGRLRRLTARGAGHVLVSDPDALLTVGTNALKGFGEDVYHLSTAADFAPASPTPDDVEEADRATVIRAVSGLHAKLYIAEGRKHTRWLVGSGNATNAAVHGNAELLVELRSTNKAARIDHLIDPADGLGRHLVPYTPEPGDPEDATTSRSDAEDALRALAASSFRGVAKRLDDGRYALDVLVDPLYHATAEVAFAARPTGRDTTSVALRPDRTPAARFPSIARADLSSYLVVTAAAGDERVERVVALLLEGVTAQELADEAVVEEVRRHDPLDYIAFVLNENEEFEYGLTFDDDDPDDGAPGGDRARHNARMAPRALLEPLLQLLLAGDSASLGQRRLADLEQAIEAFGDEIPAEFREMWTALKRGRTAR